ncbi:MAG TPA: hypothetical protein VKA84_28555 [Gemmatimonadaceae bacterium]|nr:hypothetical protein [Gemmatimonadaceae bacterium]
MNPLEELARVFWSRPAYQRYFMAFTVGLFLSCAARASKADAQEAPTASASVSASR